MSLKMIDFYCKECDVTLEALVTDDESVDCDHCLQPAVRVLSAVSLGFLNNDADKRKEVLKARSLAHTKKEQRSGNLPSAHNYGEYQRERKKKK